MKKKTKKIQDDFELFKGIAKSLEKKSKKKTKFPYKVNPENLKQYLNTQPIFKLPKNFGELENLKQFDTNRKHYPVDQGLFKYFPKALQYVSHVSWKGGDKHHPGEPVHWDRSKSQDDADALGRHLLDEGEYDEDGLLYQGKVAWRALAVLEKLLEDKNFKI